MSWGYGKDNGKSLATKEGRLRPPDAATPRLLLLLLLLVPLAFVASPARHLLLPWTDIPKGSALCSRSALPEAALRGCGSSPGRGFQDRACVLFFSGFPGETERLLSPAQKGAQLSGCDPLMDPQLELRSLIPSKDVSSEQSSQQQDISG